MLTNLQLLEITNIFNRVQGIFTYRSDPELWLREDHWEDPIQLLDQLTKGEIIGDCDNFALACRFLLLQANIPNRIAMCLTESGEGHLVCEAEGYVLDNRQSTIMAWKSLPYKWIKISDYKIGGPWRNITT